MLDHEGTPFVAVVVAQVPRRAFKRGRGEWPRLVLEPLSQGRPGLHIVGEVLRFTPYDLPKVNAHIPVPRMDGSDGAVSYKVRMEIVTADGEVALICGPKITDAAKSQLTKMIGSRRLVAELDLERRTGKPIAHPSKSTRPRKRADEEISL